MTIKIGRWNVPVKLFEQYVRTISATERSGERYNYEFDEMRQSIHREIVAHIGIVPCTRDDREFQRALQDLCEEMLPDRGVSPVPTKLNLPIRGLLK